MTRPAPIVPSHLVMAAARKIAGLKAASSLLVELEGRLVGYVDGLRLEAGRDGELVGTCMTPLGLALLPMTTAARALELLAQHHLACLPIAAGMFVVGAVSRAQLERALVERAADTARVIRAAA
jgi:CBS domain-containing protein